MKKIILLILAVTFFGCESPERVDWDKLLGGSDKDSELTDTDSGDTADDGNTGNSGDDGDAGNSGNTASDHDLDVSDTGDTGDGDTDSAFDDESDEEADLVTDDDTVLPFCGNDIWEEGEICDGNSKTCYSLGIGTSGTAECRGDCSGWVTEGVCQRTFACSDKPLNSVWNTASEYIQTWNGATWSPVDSVTSYNLTPSSTQCRFKCDTNYTWNSGSGQCVPDTRVQSCGGLPANASWNTASSITQTWNGSAWIPSSTGTYNTVSSATECRFKCNTNYNWNGSQCAAATRSGQTCTGLPSNAEWNTASSITQTWTGSDWAPTTAGVYNTTSSTTSCRFRCKTNYTWNSGSSTCVANTQTANCPAKPVTGTAWNDSGKNGTYTQTWNGSAWAPVNTTTYNTTAGDCRYICATNYTWNSGSSICVADTRTFTCADKPSANTEWNTVSNYTQTWNGTTWTPADSATAYNETASLTSCRYKCNINYIWDYVSSICVDKSIPSQEYIASSGVTFVTSGGAAFKGMYLQADKNGVITGFKIHLQQPSGATGISVPFLIYEGNATSGSFTRIHRSVHTVGVSEYYGPTEISINITAGKYYLVGFYAPTGTGIYFINSSGSSPIEFPLKFGKSIGNESVSTSTEPSAAHTFDGPYISSYRMWIESYLN